MTRLNIALGATRDWLIYSATTVASILCNAYPDDSYHFYIISDRFNTKEKNHFYSLNKIKESNFHFLKIDNSEFDGAIHDWLGVSSSYRLKLSSLVNESKILYLDSDIIALDNINELYSYDISDYYLAAVEDKCSSFMKQRVKLNIDQTFFNGGMQLINLDNFRKDNLEEIIFEKLRASKFYTDQDVINDVCRDKILSLPLKYNIVPFGRYTLREQERDEAFNNPVLLHFATKPWKAPDTWKSDEWYEFRALVS